MVYKNAPTKGASIETNIKNRRNYFTMNDYQKARLLRKQREATDDTDTSDEVRDSALSALPGEWDYEGLDTEPPYDDE